MWWRTLNRMMLSTTTFEVLAVVTLLLSATNCSSVRNTVVSTDGQQKYLTSSAVEKEATRGGSASTKSALAAHDVELVKLYLEEFRLELISIKSQLARMARNSKLVRTSLKELRTSKCLQTDKEINFDYANIDCPASFTLSSPTSCYRFAHERLTWFEAQAKCKAQNGHLLALETDAEQRFIKNHLTNTRKLQNCDFWTAGTDQFEEGVWVWNVTTSTGGGGLQQTLQRISSRSANWHEGEPNNSNGSEHCLLLDWYARWTWNDASCQTERACYACEIDI